MNSNTNLNLKLFSVLKNIVNEEDDNSFNNIKEEISNQFDENKNQTKNNLTFINSVNNINNSNVNINNFCNNFQELNLNNNFYNLNKNKNNFFLNNVYKNQENKIFKIENKNISNFNKNKNFFIINNINLFYSPPNKKTNPIRTFSFKSNNSNINQNNINNNSILKNFQIYEPAAKNLDSLLSIPGCITKKILSKIKEKLLDLIKNQQTSRILQFYLEQTSKSVIHLIFLEIIDKLIYLLIDPYANYFCLKIFYLLNDSDRIQYLKKISINIEIISNNKISTYPIQCIIENLKNNNEKKIINKCIKNNLMKLSLNIYGTHVLEKIIDIIDYQYLKNIFNFVEENFLLLSNNNNGICIVKKFIFIENKFKSENFYKLKNLFIIHAHSLIQNPFGNYALQFAFKIWDIKDSIEIMKKFYEKILFFSIQKFSSNVIERCIEISDEFSNYFINFIFNNENSLNYLLINNYGNYVVQTLIKKLEICDKNKFDVFKNILKENIIKINETKLYDKWKNYLFT